MNLTPSPWPAFFTSTFYLIILSVYVLLVIAWWNIFKKAGEDGWKSLIPFYNTYILFKISWGNGWLFLLDFIPVIGFVTNVIMNVKLSRSFGHGTGFAIGLILIPNLFTLILGFDNSVYHGPVLS